VKRYLEGFKVEIEEGELAGRYVVYPRQPEPEVYRVDERGSWRKVRDKELAAQVLREYTIERRRFWQNRVSNWRALMES
jgi:hypothetical protein